MKADVRDGKKGDENRRTKEVPPPPPPPPFSRFNAKLPLALRLGSSRVYRVHPD